MAFLQSLTNEPCSALSASVDWVYYSCPLVFIYQFERENVMPRGKNTVGFWFLYMCTESSGRWVLSEDGCVSLSLLSSCSSGEDRQHGEMVKGQEPWKRNIVNWGDPFLLGYRLAWDLFPPDWASFTLYIRMESIYTQKGGWEDQMWGLMWKHFVNCIDKCPYLVFQMKRAWLFPSYPYYPCSHHDQPFHKH